MTGWAGAIGMADTENAGIATNAQAAKPINIERFIGSPPLQSPQRRLQDNATALQEFPRLAPRDLTWKISYRLDKSTWTSPHTP